MLVYSIAITNVFLSFYEESVELVSSTPKIGQAIADDTNGKNNGRSKSFVFFYHKSICENFCLLFLEIDSVPLSPNVAIFAAAFASNSPNNTASSDSSGDQNAQSTTTISTDIRSNSEARMFVYKRSTIRCFILVDPRNWTREEVSRWFQSNKLDE